MKLFHQTLGHVSSIVLAKIFDMNKDSMCKVSNFSFCPCYKLSRSGFPSSSIEKSTCFDLIHVELWGSYKTPIFYGNKYFLTMVFLLKCKSDVCISLKLFMHYVRTQLGRNVKVLRSHNGTDFANSVCTALFKELGIIHEMSCPYTFIKMRLLIENIDIYLK